MLKNLFNRSSISDKYKNLINQIKPFNIKTHLGERVDEVKKDGENWFVKTNNLNL